MDQIRQLELENMKTDIPEFNAGDTVDVHYLIREGDKERIQVFSGTVIAKIILEHQHPMANHQHAGDVVELSGLAELDHHLQGIAIDALCFR